ncbi:MAG TPA: excinuclease ABC subunit UvrC [Thermoanaerobaculia bacterium]|nr:excinuclease ABC subunit UvrC [Thermoanaerobaculia bacterium]
MSDGEANEALRERAGEAPEQPGIYLFLDGEGGTLYVGKAKSLRKRVASYFARELEPRLESMLGEARDLEWVVAGSEREALLLENNFIKERRPRYNVLLRDDKTYPYLKLTREPWPRIVFTRRVRDDGAEYFGPYLPGGLARRAVQLVQKLFGIRVCSIPIDGRLPRPCLYWDMKRCLGPCVAGLTSPERYADAIERARLFLSGRIEPLVRELRAQMSEAAERLEFEEAARLRDLLAQVEKQGGRVALSSVEEEDADLYGVALHGRQAAVSILVMRGGRVLDRRELFWEGSAGTTPEALLSELLPQVYDRTTFLPRELHLPVRIEGEEALEDWLGERRGGRVHLRFPARGPKAERLRVAAKDAEFAFRRRFRVGGETDAAIVSLQQGLDLPEPPRWIEGFDVSNTLGEESVASLVVWREGRLRKGEYRSFNIRGLEGADDFRSIGQAVERRYRRLLEETGELPDLVLVDGGRGQLNAALSALERLGLEDLPVVGLAKREEELWIAAAPDPVRLSRHDAGLQLLQRIRDECHRFALAKHRARRSRRSLRGLLDEVPGVGPVRKRALMKRFGTVDAMRAAADGELAEVVGPALVAPLRSALSTASDASDSRRLGPEEADP